MESYDPVHADQPPADPEEWTHEQWLEWLDTTDADAGDGDAPPATPLGRITHSAGGQLLGDAMLGLANVMYGPKDEQSVIVTEGASEPGSDEPFTVHLDPEHPERSSVVFRVHPGED